MTAKVSVIIASYMRPEELKLVLESLQVQTLKPHQVVVVDSSSIPERLQIQELCHRFSHSIGATYVFSHRKSLTAQRNLGIEILRLSPPEFVQILDDDTYPEPTYLQSMVRILSADNAAVGVSGVTSLGKQKLTGLALVKKFLFLLIGIESFNEGVITASGCGVPIRTLQGKPLEAQWLFGCSMWRFSIYEKLRYEDRLVGSALFEDVLFSSLASNHGKLLVSSESHLVHSESEIARPNSQLFAYRFARNRWFVVKARGSKPAHVTSYFIANISLAIVALLDRSVNLKVRFSRFQKYLEGTLDAMFDKDPK